MIIKEKVDFNVTKNIIASVILVIGIVGLVLGFGITSSPFFLITVLMYN